MKDKSKILGVLNTGKRHSQQKEAAGVVKQIVSGGGAMNVDLSDYLLKSVWDSVFEIRIDSKGETYIFGKLPVVTQYGITMYGEGGDVNIPSIYAGLPIDNNTLVRDANGILMVNPDIELGGGLDTEELEEFLRTKNYATESWVTGKNYVNTTTLANELKKYVTLNDDETINGLKNFTKGIQINGLGITNTQDDVIYIDANLVVRGGITMYATDTVDIPSLLDSIPVASNSAKGLASFDATYFSVDNGHVTLLPDNVGLNEEELAAYLDDKKYATQSWVQSLKYATSTELDLLEDKVNDFLSGSDTDTIINKWKELEAFLSGLSESDNLATILGTKANKATTLAGYGITDAYTKSDITTLLGNYVTLATAQTITGEKNFTGGLKVNGSPIVYDATNKYWKLEGDLLVTGGVTMYGNDSEFTPSTIMGAITTDGTNLKVIDGVLTFVGETGGGLTEVHWDDVIGKPTLLSSFTDDVVAGHYLSLNGGQMSGNIGYSITPDDNGIGIPAAGTLENSQVLTGSDFTKYKSFIGTYTGSSGWNFALSIRHRNGGGKDGANYGLYITSPLFGASANLVWNRQYGGASTSWQGERVILDSHNWAQYVTALDGGNYLPIDGGTLYGVLRIFASRTSDYSIVYLGELHNIDNYSPTSGRGARFVVVNTSTNTAIGCLGLASTGVPYWSPTTAGVTHPLLYAGGDFQAVGDKHWGLTVRSKNYYTSIAAAHVDGYGFYIGSHVNDNSKYLLTCRYAVSSSVPNGYHALLVSNNGDVDANGKILSKYSEYSYYSSNPGTNTGLARIGTFDRYNGGMVIQFGAGAKDWRKAFNIIDEGWTISLLSLDSSGNLTVNGGITMYSDIRKKTKLQDVELSLSQIANAPLIEHYYNSDDKRTTHVGSIAQYWAGLNDWFCKQDQDGFYTMEIQNAALASAISVARHLQKYESKTDKKIRMLKKRISELEDEMEKLKSK